MTEVLEMQRQDSAVSVEEFDVLIVGAGISGLGSAYHLKTQSPGKSFAILEAKDDIGGTWHTHRYPGVRSDSDLYTFGYRFKPWIGPPIASAEEIRVYLRAVVAENDLGKAIRFGTMITRCSWSSADKRWTVETTSRDGAPGRTYRANFLWMCQGYYRHSEGYTPEWKGMADFKGRLIHPQRHLRNADVRRLSEYDLERQDVVMLMIGEGETAIVPDAMLTIVGIAEASDMIIEG